MAEKLIITLTEHVVWGAILQPVLVCEELSGALTILEIVGSKSTFFSKLSNWEKEIVMLSDKVSDKTLMKNYSKEKSLVEFHKKVTPETIERYIRPTIEGFHRKVVDVLKSSQLNLYFRNAIKTRVLYDVDKIIVAQDLSQVVFNFQKDNENGIRYFISLKSNNEVFDLYSKTYFGLCNEPAILVINHKLHTFSEIDIKKLIPFFTKKHIQVPSSAEKTYIKKFVKNCVEKYEVNATGINIREVNPSRKAILSLDNDLKMVPVLHLNFMYEDKLFPVDSPNKKNVYVDELDSNTSLYWFYSDKNWENRMIKILLDNGLEKSGINHFTTRKNTEVNENHEDIASMVEWLQLHKELLTNFNFQQSLPDKTYFIGEISVSTEIDTKQDWFDVHSIALFGDFKIPFARFRNHILNNIREYILPDGSIAILPQEWFTRYYELMFFSKKTDEKIRLKKVHFGIINLMQGIIQSKFSNFDDKKELPAVPKEIRAELRNYQLKGFAWLVHLYENNFGGCLADDMGLGKTLQTITLLQYISNLNKKNKPKFEQAENKISQNGAVQLSIFDAEIETAVTSFPSLVVMPTSLIHNWKNELNKFAPSLKVYIYSGVKRLKSNDIFKIFGFYDVVLTTYGTLRNDINIIQNCHFHHLILDESQYVKNPDSMAYKCVKQINALHKIALTGTPVENSLTDLWAQLNIVNEGLLGNQNSFKNAYINPILKNNKAKEDALLRMIQPFILRRTKDEVAPELPPLSQETVYCDMSDEQQIAYNEEKNKLRSSLLINDVSFDHQKLAFLTLQGLSRLRLLANHPVLIDKEYGGDSGKFEQIIMRFETLKSENHKVLIFSSFVKHLRLLADYFEKENWKYSWLSGSTPATSRETEIERFKNDPEVNCFFISLKAGGVGLNLTAADYVFIIDPWWNPASEMQALSRSHRIGQDKNVMVYRFISSETIEEKIRNLQESKSKLAETFITSSNPLKDLNKEEMVKLIE
ncbi:MAG: DEAD/DEAH box helicase [Paludibacter sp.]